MNQQMKKLRKVILLDIKEKLVDAFILFTRLKWLSYLPDFSILDIEGQFKYFGGDIQFIFPWIESNFKKAEEAMLSQGWQVYKRYEDLNEYSSYKLIHFTHPAVTKNLQWFTLKMRATLEGSTCVVSQIGETKEVKEVVTPLFEVTCEEGADEQIFT